jgi:hypothetical protein
MSDTPQGPGWWKASDDKWYEPAEQAATPARPPPPTAGAVPPPPQKYVAAPPPKSGMSGCLIAFLVVAGLFVVGIIGFIILAVVLVDEAVEQFDDYAEEYDVGREKMGPIEEETGIETSSANFENPPQYDLSGDTTCDLDANPLTASGEVVNHSSETSDYIITVVFEEGSGTRFEQATAILNRVAPEERVPWEATAFTSSELSGADVASCRVTIIDRFSVDFNPGIPLDD